MGVATTLAQNGTGKSEGIAYWNELAEFRMSLDAPFSYTRLFGQFDLCLKKECWHPVVVKCNNTVNSPFAGNIETVSTATKYPGKVCVSCWIRRSVTYNFTFIKCFRFQRTENSSIPWQPVWVTYNFIKCVLVGTRPALFNPERSQQRSLLVL